MTAVLPDLSAFLRPAKDGAQALELRVEGARCATCLGKIEKGVAALPGVIAARLNLTSGKLSVTLRGGDPAQVVETLGALGYPAHPYDPAEARRVEDQEGKRLLRALAVAGFGAGNVMMFSVPVWAGFFGQELGPAAQTMMYWLSALIATPCALYAGMPFFESAWRSLRRGRANMDVPITIGVLLTLAVSFSETLLGGAHAYFDAAVSLLFLLLIGRYLDHRLKAKARSAARDLLALQAPAAARLDAEGREHMIPVGEVAVGDLLAVAVGERIPVDGQVAQGASSLDNGLITGESAPVAVAAGAACHAGALNLSGRLVIRAAARSQDSTVAAIARLMEAGAQSKSAYVRLADKAAAIYVPVVHSLALLTFAGGWALGLEPREALLRAAALLIITCPCALGLAVPAVQITASGRLFRKGVLVKSGAALERLAEVNHVVLDKTGVLTEGRPRLVGAPRSVVLMVAPLARASRHPLARAVAEAAGCGEVATDVTEVPGQGVEGYVAGRKARLGRASFVGASGGDGAETELWFAFENDTKVRLRFADSLRPDAAQAVAALKARGLTVEILSGDLPGPVGDAARAAGVERWSAALTPFDKAGAIDRMAAAGWKVLMIGDGLNDAAALAKAHAAMAPGTALDASQNAADLVFSGGLMAAPLAIDVARAARARALENFTLSGTYNLLAAPAAILGLVNPLFAAIAMSVSSLAVTANALRMNWAGGRR